MQHLSWGITAHTLRGVHGEHQVNTENLHQRVKTQCSGGSKIPTFHPAASSLANYNGTTSTSSTLLSCTHATKKSVTVLGWDKFLPSLLSTYFLAVLEISVCAYNPCMHAHTWFCCGPCGVAQINLLKVCFLL